jgi:hypothetical protein
LGPQEEHKISKGSLLYCLQFFSLTAQLPNQVLSAHQDVCGDEQTNLGAAQTKNLASYIFFSDKKKEEVANTTFGLSAIRIHC